ncbi:MFS transporter [Corynebacterium sp. 13CS0277]|uniref:MFS transporter n=1 Tax=Corynebacterium sp. 13CS0277 TaxID=2071994 RepID=UPI000D03DB9A|nr:MFS transporter [Corynebacterium sp. 13CS0277]PRQ11289.1 MFS transporter [Corynebacterium sp. 13CS0277]
MATATQARRSLGIAALGTIIEWFDYSLFFYLAGALAATFYPGRDDSLLLVLATGAIGFVFRPLGAVVFGHIGDTRGRATALVASAGLMAVAMAGIAAMPAGTWGGVGVLCLRALAGFSVGAEYTGIMVYLMENARPHRRGFVASWAAAGSEVGALLAVGSAALVGVVLGEEGLYAWGWRLPFVVGAVLAAAMIPLRRWLVDTPPPAAGENPLSAALRTQRRAIAVSFLISTVGSATYFLTITYIPTFMESTGMAGGRAALSYGVAAAVAAILVTPAVGWVSDRVGRRAAFAALLAAVVIVVVPGYWLLGVAALPAVVLLAVPAAGWSAVAAAAVPEQFSAFGRYSGMALGYNLATVIFGGLTPPVVEWLVHATGNHLMPAYYAGGIAVLAGIPALMYYRTNTPQPVGRE